jgi:hypothetical protein
MYAGRDALRTLTSASKKGARARKKLKARRVSEALAPHGPHSPRALEEMVWRLEISGAPVPLEDYPHSGGAHGRPLVVQVNVGKKVMVKGLFEAVMKSGHKGIFLRKGAERFPIKEAFSTNVANVVGDLHEDLFNAAQNAFDVTFERVMKAEVDKALSSHHG